MAPPISDRKIPCQTAVPTRSVAPAPEYCATKEPVNPIVPRKKQAIVNPVRPPVRLAATVSSE